MPTLFLDTSALLKRYKTEDGTDFIDELFDLFDPPAINGALSFLTILGVTAAGSRAREGNLIGDDDLDALMGSFLADANRYFVLRGLDAAIFIRAMNVSLSYGLRTADALQLATALDLNETMNRSNERLIFLADDEELVHAARREGLATVHPRQDEAIHRLNDWIVQTE